MNPPKGYRHCVVGEIFPASDVLYCNLFSKKIAPTELWTGCEVREEDVGFYFFKKEVAGITPQTIKLRKTKKTRKNKWTDTPTDIFNKIFPVKAMDFEDCQQYLAAIIERKFTQEEFTKLCKVMAKERIDAIGE